MYWLRVETMASEEWKEGYDAGYEDALGSIIDHIKKRRIKATEKPVPTTNEIG